MARAAALTLAVLLLVPAVAGAQAVTRGSSLAPPANVPFGCEATVEQDFLGSGLFVLTPTGQPSCAWWSSGLATDPTNPNTGYVPTTGTVTTVRVKSGPNPAPLRIVQLRSTAGCCTVVRQTGQFQPAPNTVTQVTINWLMEVVRDAVAGVSTTDIVGFSAAGGTGTLPLHDQGAAAHTPQAAFSPGVHSGTMTAPAPQSGSLLGGNFRGAVGYEPLVQYDFIACPALNNRPIAPGQTTCPGQPRRTPAREDTDPTAVLTNGTPGVPVLRIPTALLTIRRDILPVALACSLDIGCSGTLRLAIAAANSATAAARTRTLATRKFTMKKGRHTVRVRLSKKARSRLRRKTTTVTAVVTMPGRPTVRQTLKVRR
jgi:hypothetical protein